MDAKNKITKYNDLIGKKILKIEEDGFNVRFYFIDGTFATITGSATGGFVELCEWEGVEDLIDSAFHCG